MAEERYTETTTRTNAEPAAPQTTIIERRGGGGGMLIGLAVLALVVVLAWFLFSQNRNEAVRTDAVSDAAAKVGEGAEKAGAAIEKAVE